MTDGPAHPRPAGTVQDRHHGAALGPDLELLARRQGQLRGRPEAGDAVPRDLPGHRDRWPAPRGRSSPARSRYLAGEAGIRQFLDIGTGLPTVDNTHQVAQRVAPEARIVYVDNDPLVLVHARALLTSTPEGATDYIDADLHDPEQILRGRRRDAGLRPAGRADADGHPRPHRRTTTRPARSCAGCMAALPSGSYLVLYDGTDTDPALEAGPAGLQRHRRRPLRLRSPEQIAASSRAWS